MPRVSSLIGGRGATFPTEITNWPLCCPSRATMLNGQYAHNHGVLGNQPPYRRLRQLNLNETLPVWLAALRLLHGPHRQVPQRLRGQRRRRSARVVGVARLEVRPTRFYGYKLLENGADQHLRLKPRRTPTPRPQPETYSTDVYSRQGRRRDQRARPLRTALLPLGRLPRTARRRPERRASTRRPAAVQGTAKPAVRHIGAFEPRPSPGRRTSTRRTSPTSPSGIAGRAQLSQREHPQRHAQLPLPRRVAAGDRRGRRAGHRRARGQR